MSNTSPANDGAAEDPSMSSLLVAPLDTLQELSHTLFLSLGPTQAKPPPLPPLSAFIACDDALAAAVQMAHVHQTKQKRIDQLQSEILGLDVQWRQVCMRLEQGRRELETVIKEGEERISLSAFTSAPPNMPDMSLPDQPPPPLFFPPFPNEEKMRRGHLNQEVPLGMAGETHSVGRPPTASPIPIQAMPAPGPNPYRQEHRPHQSLIDLDLDLNPDL